MSSGELDQFLRESRAFAKVGTLDPEGWPWSTGLYSYVDGFFWIVTKEKRRLLPQPADGPADVAADRQS
jgi:hypothetical protein